MGGQITRNAFYGKKYTLTLRCSCCGGDLVLQGGGVRCFIHTQVLALYVVLSGSILSL